MSSVFNMLLNKFDDKCNFLYVFSEFYDCIIGLK